MTIKKMKDYDDNRAFIDGKKYERVDLEGVSYLVRAQEHPGQAYRVLEQQDIEGQQHCAVEIKNPERIEKIVEQYFQITEMSEMEEW